MFTPNTIHFLVENRLQNSREWYNSHKEVFAQVVVEPFRELASELAPTMEEIDREFICDPKRIISRVHRDLRFSKDKTLYREAIWLTFSRDKKAYKSLPAYFFEISPNGFVYGCGHYAAGTENMESLRRLILDGDRQFKKALKAYTNQDIFRMEGDAYKKSRYPDKPEELRCWLDRKSIYFMNHSKDFELLYSDRLAEVLKEGFLLLEPVYKLFMRAVLKTTK